MKYLIDLWRGLAFFTRVNDGSLNIVSLHWPDALCWSWLFNVDLRRGLLNRPWLGFQRWTFGPFSFCWQARVYRGHWRGRERRHG